MNYKIKRAGRKLKEFITSPETRYWAICVLIGIFAICIISIIVQFAWPSNRATANVKLAGNNVGWWTRSDIERFANSKTSQTRVKFTTTDGEQMKPMDELGGSVCADCVSKQALEYPWWQKLLPLSLLWRSVSVGAVAFSFDESILDAKLAEYDTKLTLPPKNAHVSIQGNKVEIVSEKAGRKLSAREAAVEIKAATYKLAEENRPAMNGQEIAPKVKASQLSELRTQVEKILTREFELRFNDITFTMDKAQIAGILQFVPGKYDIPVVQLDQEKLAKILEEKFGSKINKPAGTTVIYLVDGAEAKREVGVSGQGIDEAAVARNVQEILFGEGAVSTVDVAVKPVAPKNAYRDTFTHSQRGLQAYLNSLSRDGDIRVTVSQIGGEGWTAQSRGVESAVAASTYKLYISTFIMEKIDSGEWSMDKPLNGVSTKECLQRTILNSDNACPEAAIKQFGATAINNYIRSKGFGSTALRSQAMTSTNDLATMLKGIDGGSIVKGSNRDFLLDLMKRQVYRSGVPAGSGGLVQDKVGFLEGYLNDAAIVTHPKGKYVIAIITKNQSWAKIAEITHKVEGLMY